MSDRSDDKRERRRRRGCCLGGCLLWMLSLLSAASVAAVMLLRANPGEDRWETALLVYAPQLPFAVLPALAVLWALLARRSGLLLANLLVLGVALTTVADLQVPAPPPPAKDAQTVRILTWNLHSRAIRVEQMREHILEWDPDVVCVQEARYDSFRDLLPGYQQRRGGDTRVFSRLEILDFRRVSLGPSPPRLAVVCDVQTDAGPLTVLALHFPRASERHPRPRDLVTLEEHVRDGMAVRDEKFEALLSYLPDDRPLVVAGDMNTPPASRYHSLLSERMTDAFAARGTGFGYTWLWRGRWPLLRIDYIWCGGGVRPVNCFTGHAHFTDHRQVIADVLVPVQVTDSPTAN